LALLLCGCASKAPAIESDAAKDSRRALACTLPSPCVNSADSDALGPLRYAGTTVQALTLLRATLAEFPEAQILSIDNLSLEAVFTTAVGFRDLVSFRIDAQAQRIH